MTDAVVRAAIGADDLRRAAELRWEWKGSQDHAARAAFADGLVAWADARAALILLDIAIPVGGPSLADEST